MKKSNILISVMFAGLSAISGVLAFQDSKSVSELEISDVELMAEAELIPYHFREHYGSFNWATFSYWCEDPITKYKIEGSYCGTGPGLCIGDDRCH